MTYNVTRDLQQYDGYGFFSAGDFFEKTAPNKDSHFMYATVEYTFLSGSNNDASRATTDH
jgi:hypothetical protein